MGANIEWNNNILAFASWCARRGHGLCARRCRVAVAHMVVEVRVRVVVVIKEGAASAPKAREWRASQQRVAATVVVEFSRHGVREGAREHFPGTPVDHCSMRLPDGVDNIMQPYTLPRARQIVEHAGMSWFMLGELSTDERTE